MKFKGSPAFTLIEVLISIALLGLLLTALYSMLDTQRINNKKLYEYLQKSMSRDRGVMVLYNDIIQSDGNISIKHNDFDNICIENSNNSLYALGVAKVCWIVSKDGNNLIRLEGNNYKLPLNSESKISADIVMKDIKSFKLAFDTKKGIIVVVLQKNGQEPYTFAIYGIKKPIYPKKKKKKKSKIYTPKNIPDKASSINEKIRSKIL